MGEPGLDPFAERTAAEGHAVSARRCSFVARSCGEPGAPEFAGPTDTRQKSRGLPPESLESLNFPRFPTKAASIRTIRDYPLATGRWENLLALE
jgi:hypothetical protein